MGGGCSRGMVVYPPLASDEQLARTRRVFALPPTTFVPAAPTCPLSFRTDSKDLHRAVPRIGLRKLRQPLAREHVQRVLQRMA
jgi:hypothetical protein